MDINLLYAEWEKDGEIDPSNVSNEARRIPKLHNKYYKMYYEQGLKLRKLKAEYKILVKHKSEWYRGEMDDEELKEHGWQPMRLKILRADIPQYLESDPDIIKKSLLIGAQEELVAYLESIVKQISFRNNLLTNIVNWEKFRTGA